MVQLSASRTNWDGEKESTLLACLGMATHFSGDKYNGWTCAILTLRTHTSSQRALNIVAPEAYRPSKTEDGLLNTRTKDLPAVAGEKERVGGYTVTIIDAELDTKGVVSVTIEVT